MNEKNQAPAPATDPALDALDEIETTLSQEAALSTAAYLNLATIRDALADRITPAEAQQALSGLRGWWGTGTPSEQAIMVRLGRIADSETGR